MTDPHSVLKHATHAAELIPGDPAGLAAAAEELRTAASRTAATTDRLQSAQPTGWAGTAAEATRDHLARQVSDYAALGEGLRSAADALSDHRDALARAQQQTQEAIERWHAADRQTSAASRQYQQLAAQRRSEAFHARQHNQPAPRPLAPWSDPMAAEKRAAVEQWHDAELRYSEAVEATKAALRAARDHLPLPHRAAAGEPPSPVHRTDWRQLHQQLVSGATAVQMMPQVDSWDSWSADHPDRATGELTAPPGEREDSP